MLYPQSTALFLAKMRDNLSLHGSIPKTLHKTFAEHAPKQNAWIAIFQVVQQYDFPRHQQPNNRWAKFYPRFDEYTLEQNQQILTYAIQYCNEVASS